VDHIDPVCAVVLRRTARRRIDSRHHKSAPHGAGGRLQDDGRVGLVGGADRDPAHSVVSDVVADIEAQAFLIRRYIAWRNRHAQDRMLREVVKRTNVA
jgi:hypothetical protein